MTEQHDVEPKRVLSNSKKKDIIVGLILIIFGSILFLIGWFRAQGGTIQLLDQGGTISLLGSFPVVLGLGMISYNWYGQTRKTSETNAKSKEKDID
jgi:uncharacterized membrane protein